MTEHSISLSALAASLAGGAHSIFGASSSHMYLACSGSLIPNILAKDDSGEEAAYGTVAHMVTEQWLNYGRPSHLIGTRQWVEAGEWGYLIDIDEKMFDYVEQSVDRCEWQPGFHVVERHVDFSHLTPIPNQGGTLDFAALQRSKRRARVVDHKYGASPENIVHAVDNSQLMLYAIGLWRDAEFADYDFQDFILQINQPRLDHFDEWHITAKHLAEFEDYARDRMAAAWQYNAPRTPGVKQCRFCKVRGTCSAAAKLQEDLMAAAFDGVGLQTAEDMKEFVERLDDEIQPFDMNMVKVGQLSTAQMAKLLPFQATAEAWWKALRIELNNRKAAGEEIPGMKAVEARTRRKFKDAERARTALIGYGLASDDIERRVLVSPRQAEEKLRRVGFAKSELPSLLKGLVYKPPGQAVLVPVSDRRPELQDVTAAVFGDLTTNRETTEDEEM